MNNLIFGSFSEEKDLSSVINADNTLGNNEEKVLELEEVNELHEILTDVRSERSSVSKQDVLDMIKDNNVSIDIKFDGIKMELNDLRTQYH